MNQKFTEFARDQFNESHRFIKVNYDNNKKPSGERNNYTLEEIKNDKGTGNTYSIYLKHTSWIVIDIDEADYDYNNLPEFLKQFPYTKGNTKGFHIYVKLKNKPHTWIGSEINIFKKFTGDLIGWKNNIWEKSDKYIYNYEKKKVPNIKFEELQPLISKKYQNCGTYINEKKDKTPPKNKPIKTQNNDPPPKKKSTKSQNEKATNEQLDILHTKINKYTDKNIIDELMIIINIINMFSEKRYNEYNHWITVGMVLKNEFGDLGFDTFDYFSAKSPKYQGLTTTKAKYTTLKYDLEHGMTCATLFMYAKEDDYDSFIKFIKSTKKIHLGFNHNQSTTEIAQYLRILLKGEIIIPGIKNFPYCYLPGKNNIYTIEYNTEHALCEIVEDYMLNLMNDYTQFKITQITRRINHLTLTLAPTLAPTLTPTDDPTSKTETKQEISKLEKYTLTIFKERKKILDNSYLKKLTSTLMKHFNDQEFLKKIGGTPHTIAFNNGLLDLKDGSFRKIEKEDSIVRCLDYDYQPSNEKDKCAIKKIINQICNDDDNLTEFLLSWLGYCLTGCTKVTKFLTVVGQRAENGKSTIAQIFKTCFPQYTEKMSTNLFAKGYAQVHKEMAEIKYARMVFIEELPDKNLDTKLLKNFCDGSIRNTIMYGTSETISLQAKLYIASTVIPTFKVDEGIKRRGIIIQCNNKFVDKETYEALEDKTGYYLKDAHLQNKFETENSYKYGFVNLIIDYAKKYYATGLQVPSEYAKGFNDVCEVNDKMNDFIDTYYNVTNNPDHKVHKNDFTSTYNDHFKCKVVFASLLSDIKRLNFKYEKDMRVDGKKGVIIGLDPK